MKFNYWEECIDEALEEAGITATAEQRRKVADFVAGAHDNYGMAHGHDAIPNPMVGEIAKLKKDLVKEREMVTCGECGGTGRFISYGPYHSAESECHLCRGRGRL